ncbi:hypothetical protein [Neobacillus sp. YIM B06451]|uniref:hypothetical protein n=1 Tax=Neobacillus sp. YIM B06451 TaxID=3070994 RepID=UPI00292E30CD|nr:hypothetical protein [Neobacillus sp. YIM B06451]
MLDFLCISSNIDSNITFEDINKKDVVFVLGQVSSQLSSRILSEISGEKYSLMPMEGFECFNLKTFNKGNIKIGGLSTTLSNNKKITSFLTQQNELSILLLDENPENNPLIMNYIYLEQPKYIFFNSPLQTNKKVGNTRLIGLSTFSVEKYFTS